MTACASPGVPAPTDLRPPAPPATGTGRGDGPSARPGCTITADGAYAARLVADGGARFPERWTLDGPEPYAVPLPGGRTEDPGTEVLPMGDGRVLVHRPLDEYHAFSLLYPTGPGTGEVPLGAVECPDEGARLALLPPAPGGTRAYALAVGPLSTAVWLVAGGSFGPEHLATVPGRCSGGVWLGGGDRLLALDRELDGRTKSVVVDLGRGGEVSPLLQITEESDDRLLLADAASGLLLISSDAPSPGRPRLGWGVLGSSLPVRFPQCLRPAGTAVRPFAIQPGQVLTPEHCAVALWIDGGGDDGDGRVGVWRPYDRQVHRLRAPEGWLTGTGVFTKDGVLRLPYATEAVPCGIAEVTASARAGDAWADLDVTAGARGAARQDRGSRRDQREQREQGLQGDRGSQGEQEGTAGPTDPAGSTVPAGSAGPADLAGPAGPAGAAGCAGPAGPAGPVEPAGSTVSAVGDARGAQGTPHTAGGPWGPAPRAVPLRDAPLRDVPRRNRAVAEAFRGRRMARGTSAGRTASASLPPPAPASVPMPRPAPLPTPVSTPVQMPAPLPTPVSAPEPVAPPASAAPVPLSMTASSAAEGRWTRVPLPPLSSRTAPEGAPAPEGTAAPGPGSALASAPMPVPAPAPAPAPGPTRWPEAAAATDPSGLPTLTWVVPSTSVPVFPPAPASARGGRGGEGDEDAGPDAGNAVGNGSAPAPSAAPEK